MKKLLAIVMAMIMAAASGCAGSSVSVDTKAPDDNHAYRQDGGSGKAKPGEPAASPKDEHSSDFAAGKIYGGVYINRSADLSFTLPDGWSFIFGKELNDLMSQNSEEYGDDAADIAEILTVHDCMAINAEDTANVNFTYENTAMSCYDDISAKDYSESITDYLISTAPEGWSYEITDSSEVELAGFTYCRTALTIDAGDEVNPEQIYYFRKLGDYMLSICVTTFPGISEPADEIITYIGNSHVNPTPSPAAVEKTSPLEKGSISGNVYTNELADISITIPNGWEFYSDEELAKRSERLSAGDNSSAIYTCIAENKETGAQLLLSFEDISAFGPAGITAKEWGDSIANAALAGDGSDANTLLDSSEIQICGKTYYRTILGLAAGKDIGLALQMQSLSRDTGDGYMLNIITYTVEGITESYDEILGFIS